MTKIALKKPAFSLAEALITLLIVCLITIASVPVLTKKKRMSTSENHGKWMCTLNTKGQHVYWTKNSSGDPDNPDTWTVSNDNKCRFVPPLNSRNYSISGTAGGGGGSSASHISKTWIEDFIVEYPGVYNMIAIGGGGAGGTGTDGDYYTSGGAGAVVQMKILLDERVKKLKLQKGPKGFGIINGAGMQDGITKYDERTDYTGSAGGDSIIKADIVNDSGITETHELILASGGIGGWGKEGHGFPARSGFFRLNIPEHMRKYTSCNVFGRKAVYGDYVGGHTSPCTVIDNYGEIQPGVNYESLNGPNKLWGYALKDSTGRKYKICNYGRMEKKNQITFNSFFANDRTPLYPEIECDPDNPAFDNEAPNYTISERMKFCNIPGLGGGSKYSLYPCFTETAYGSKPGTDGFVEVFTQLYSSGRGGEAGEAVSNKFYPKIESKYLDIVIGSGGKGGEHSFVSKSGDVPPDSVGARGGDTVITDDKNAVVIGLTGGLGANSIYSTKALTNTSGGNGGETTLFYAKKPVRGLGGYSYANPAKKTGLYNDSKDGKTSAGYGDGGGGGGYDASLGVLNGAGKGGDGANGIVIIEW